LYTYSNPRPNYRYSYSPWRPKWLPPVEVAGEFQIPVLQPTALWKQPTGTNSIHREPPPLERETSLLHGFVDDAALFPLLKSPAGSLIRFAQYYAITTPDFSVQVDMPFQDRVRSVWNSRAIGAYYQARGLRVIPNIRWARQSDLSFVLDGLSVGGTIALSTQGLVRDSELLKIFNDGCGAVTEKLSPQHVVVYGKIPANTSVALQGPWEIWNYETDFAQVFSKRKK
jgi:hypothetical protein